MELFKRKVTGDNKLEIKKVIKKENLCKLDNISWYYTEFSLSSALTNLPNSDQIISFGHIHIQERSKQS